MSAASGPVKVDTMTFLNPFAPDFDLNEVLPTTPP
jgi:hypothetical protein